LQESSFSDIAADESLLNEFLQESQDSLSSLEPLFIELERNEGDEQVLHAIFRSIHSLKGNAAFFRLTPIKHLAHDLESLLDDLRKHRLTMNKEIMDVVLKSTDELKAMLYRIGRSEKLVTDEQVYNRLLENIKGVQQGKTESDQIRALVGKVQTFLHELRDTSPTAVEHAATMAKELDDYCRKITEEMSAPPRKEREEGKLLLRSTNQVITVGEVDVSREIAALKDIMSNRITTELEEHLSRRVRVAISSLEKKLKGEPRNIVAEMARTYDIFQGSPVGFDEVLRLTLMRLLENLESHASVQTVEKTEGKAQKADSGETPYSASDPAKAVKTIRVPEDSIDAFMRNVEELDKTILSFGKLKLEFERQKVSQDTLLRYADFILKMSKLSDELESGIAAIRMVPARILTQKIPRLARDLAESLNKKIHILIHGDEILLDKSLVESLEDPITHLIRNCLDHGIEPPETRKTLGKPEEGLIRVSFETTDNYVVLTIADDGAGIDLERLKKKAIESGLISSERASKMTQEETLNLIFVSGVTTAEKVSDVSGRGVGLDIVRTNIDNVNGSIAVASSRNRGTTFRITLPGAAAKQ
jgi:two-component system, chemotaxis family, sensor kinase CheA